MIAKELWCPDGMEMCERAFCIQSYKNRYVEGLCQREEQLKKFSGRVGGLTTKCAVSAEMPLLR